MLTLGSVLMRGLGAQPFEIPSESMLPQLLTGDYVVVSKFSYGLSRYSLPFGILPIRERAFGRMPRRGEVVVFRTPNDLRTDAVKRVIGLPGDKLSMASGQITLNGTPVPRFRVADLVLPMTPNTVCRSATGPVSRIEHPGTPQAQCRLPRFREMLPGAAEYAVIDQGFRPGFDDIAELTVMPGTVFVLGDNRDDSADSRFDVDVGGTGPVPLANLEGPVVATAFSSDGSAALLKPWTWWSAIRWSRIGAW